MSGLVKSPLQTAVVESIYNDVLTKNAQYYYFLGKTDKWSEKDGASYGEDGVISSIVSGGTDANGVEIWIPILTAPSPLPTPRYELETRNNIITYKLVKSSDVCYVIPRYNWTPNMVYDMYDDYYSSINPAYSGATSLEAWVDSNGVSHLGAKYYVLTTLNNVYKCISNNYDAHSTIEPFGTSVDEFTTDDGYIWQFMYNIPIALQNKFYTPQFIPVMTSLRNRFYENGAIGSVSVQEPGHGYNDTVSLAVAGDGYQENNPYAVDEFCIILNGGAGYKSSALISGITWLSTVATVTSVGHGFVNGDNITIRGVTPTNYNGNFVVAGAASDTFTVTIANNPGSYSAGGTISKSILTASVPLWGSFKTQAKCYTTVTGGIITLAKCDIQVVNAQNVYGYGYDQSGTIAVNPPVIHDFEWSASTSYALNKIIKANDNFYQVTVAGTSGTTLPTHLNSTAANGGCTLLFVGTQASIKLTLTKTEAIMHPIVVGGQIIGVVIDEAGVGYTYCNVTPVDTSPTNTPVNTALLVADVAIGNVDTIQADVELAAFNIRNGAISYIKMEKYVSGPNTGDYITGFGYGVDTTVQIIGDGVGAAAEPVIVNGSIIGINLTNRGTDYTREAIVKILPERIVGGVDVGAKARAILSPSGGHGSNAIKEFHSNTILFYSVLSDERIHKLQNLNDYRQFGIIKNPKRYGSSSRLSTTTATACWLVISTNDINIQYFLKDDLIDQGGTDVYRVVEVSGDKMIIQSFSQTVPSLGNFINRTVPRVGNSLSVKSLTPPQVDKFSGDILFIDNKLPFVVTVDQMIAFRTTVGF